MKAKLISVAEFVLVWTYLVGAIYIVIATR